MIPYAWIRWASALLAVGEFHARLSALGHTSVYLPRAIGLRILAVMYPRPMDLASGYCHTPQEGRVTKVEPRENGELEFRGGGEGIPDCRRRPPRVVPATPVRV